MPWAVCQTQRIWNSLRLSVVQTHMPPLPPRTGSPPATFVTAWILSWLAELTPSPGASLSP